MPKKIEQIKLRVFEAFAGIGAQASALKRMKIDYEIVGISEWFIDAIECYAAIHCKDIKVCVPQNIKEVDEYLSRFTFSADSVNAYNIKNNHGNTDCQICIDQSFDHIFIPSIYFVAYNKIVLNVRGRLRHFPTLST